jgi:Tfp pilus assembly major pilin PilA
MGILTVLTWVLIVGAVGGSAYYLFFKKPELVGQLAAPSSFKNTEQLSKLSLNPKEVVDNLSVSFRQYVTPLSSSNRGRTNPFLGF